MLQKLIERRRQGSEKGFTLIELMVVVLIIAILIAIAIPTFLGARGRAQNRSAQSNLRNGLTAEKTLFTDNDQYSADVTTALPGVEPSLHWVADAAFNNATKNTVAVAVATTNTTNDTVYLGALADSGKCYYIKDVSNAPGAGVTYATAASSAGSCGKPSTATGFNSDPGVGWTS